MLSAKSFLIASFVINVFIQIRCNQANNGLSNVIDVDDSSRREAELNPKYIEVIDIVSELSTPGDFTDGHNNCDCDGIKCLRCLDGDDQRSFETMFLLTASEVILGTAVIMGLSALITILMRLCSRSRTNSRNSQNISTVPDEFGRTGIRVSLTSLQQRVMSKLRDRPPRYETRHNYEYQRRDRSTRISVLNPAAATMSNSFPPPSYEASDNNSIHELPPAYSIAIEDSGGILNQSFASEESAARYALGATNSDINSASRTSDNVLHI